MIRHNAISAGLAACLALVAACSQGNALAQAPGPAETFEGVAATWQVTRIESGSGGVTRSTERAAEGVASAAASTSAAGSTAYVRTEFTSPAGVWNERPGRWHWQRASIFLPAASVAALGADQHLTIGGLWSSSGGTGWYLRVHANGQLHVTGRNSDNAEVTFPVYGTFPTDTWVELELGLHSQNGPGVKRAFSFLIDGTAYGWFHQGRMTNETYDRVAMGVLDTNSNAQLKVYVDRWQAMTTDRLPGGPDNRSTAELQEIDFRNESGVQWQIDWSTWSNQLKLHPQYGLYSADSRLQSGLNIDRLPDVSNGWGEIEIDWPNGTPPAAPGTYFGPMIGMRKEINREENLEVIPVSHGGGDVRLTLEAWVGGGPVLLAEWQMPLATSIAGTRIPEPGDIIRVRWQETSPGTLNIRASYYDASTATWHTDAINTDQNISAISNGGTTVDFSDGFHTASSITIDSQFYSIRRYKVGTLSTFPDGQQPAATATATSTRTPTPTTGPGLTPSPVQTVTATATISFVVTSRVWLPIVLKP